MAIVPVMFGIGYEVDFLNQGGALIHVYTDGSVLLNHGGVEMGQGLYTKMIQVNALFKFIFLDWIALTEISNELFSDC